MKKIRNDPTISAPNIKAGVENELGVIASTSTFKRVLKNHGNMLSRSQQNIIKMLKFAREHVDKPDLFWRNILWSDESKFNIFGSDGRRRV